MWCSSHTGVSSAGSIVCLSYTGASSSVGGEVVANMGLRLYPSGSATQTNTTVGVRLQACETYGLDYWAPAQGLWIAAVILIATSRSVIKRFFVHNAA